MKRLTLLYFTLLSTASLFAQTTFFSTFSRFVPSRMNEVSDFVITNDGNYMLVGERSICYVNQNGEEVWREEVPLPFQTMYLEAVEPTSSGHFLAGGWVYDTQAGHGKLFLLKFNGQGDTLWTKIYTHKPGQNADRVGMKELENGDWIVASRFLEKAGSPHQVFIMRTDSEGNEIWSDHLQYKNQSTSFTDLEVTDSDLITLLCLDYPFNYLIQLSTDNKILNEVQLAIKGEAAVAAFTSTSDGDFVYTGNMNRNFLLLKTDRNGNVKLQEEIDGANGDSGIDIKAMADGYVMAGYTNDDLNTGQFPLEMALLKTDLAGDLQWIKAFGTSNGEADFANRVRIAADDGIVVGGYATPVDLWAPVLFKTNSEGNIDSAKPFDPKEDGFLPLSFHDSTGLQNGRGIVPLADGAFMITGAAVNAATGIAYLSWLKTDASGEVSFTRSLGETFPGVPTFMYALSNGNMAIGGNGELASFERQNFLVEIDESGDTLYTRRYNGFATTFDDAAVLDNDHLLVTGVIVNGFTDPNFFGTRFDIDGNVLWGKSYQGAKYERSRKIIPYDESSYMMVGFAQTIFDYGRDVLLIRIDEDGKELFRKSITPNLWNDAYDATVRPSGNVVVVGSTGGIDPEEKDLLLLEVDAQGNTVQQKILDIHLQDFGIVLSPTADGGYIVGGRTGEQLPGPLETFAFVMKVDAAFDVVWERYYGKEGEQMGIKQVITTSDNKFAFTGTFQNAWGRSQPYLMLLDENGESPSPSPITGNPEPGVASSLVVYPNPAREQLHISITGSATGTGDLRVYDTTGKAVVIAAINKESEVFEALIKLTDLKPGYYFLRGNIGNQYFTRSFVRR